MSDRDGGVARVDDVGTPDGRDTIDGIDDPTGIFGADGRLETLGNRGGVVRPARFPDLRVRAGRSRADADADADADAIA